MKETDLPESVRERRAIVYVRQSTAQQARGNLESQRRQYELVAYAKSFGFKDVAVIDADLGRSASGMSSRPGFESLVSQLCQGSVGAIFCLEASRLARNGREWHHLLELCGLAGARVIDTEGVYDPSQPNDRLLMGLKGSMSEFEISTMRHRMIDAARAKAARGELRIPVPVGYIWRRDTGLELDPDLRIQEAIHAVFRLFERLGSGRQVLLHMRREGLVYPRPANGKRLERVEWRAPSYRNIISVLQNPFYAGAYAYGKSTTRTTLENGVPHKRSGQTKPMERWSVLLWGHHEAYVSRSQFERTQEKLAANAFCKGAGRSKSGRGGRALLPGLLRCRRCSRMLQVAYSGKTLIRYSCRRGNMDEGLDVCISFGARRPEQAIVNEVLEVVAPLGVEAALMAEERNDEVVADRVRALELERQQAEYEVQIATRRYQSVDPDNRLVAAELEARWNTSLERLQECENRLSSQSPPVKPSIDPELLNDLGADLRAVWHAPGTDGRTKQRLIRTLVEEIVVDVDDETRQVILLIHWKGGRHSEVRVVKPKTGEHTCGTPAEATAIICEMATKWTDEHIAAMLNRIGMRTGYGLTWNAGHVRAVRSTNHVHGYASRSKDGAFLTMVEAAAKLGVSCHVVRRLIARGLLPAKQTMKDAPWQIDAADLESPELLEAVHTRPSRGQRPCRGVRDNRTLVIPGT